MLVVAANWAFTDGTLVAAAGRSRAARTWLRSLRAAAIRFGFGRDGVYRPPTVLEIVLAGDTFDCLTSAAWRGPLRPWHGGIRAASARRGVVDRCARRASPLLAGLAGFVRRGLEAPVADRRGRPSAATRRVPVRVTFLAGDRDRCILEAAPDFAARGGSVTVAWSDGTVLVRHGHEFDPACHVAEPWSTGDRPPTLAESVAVGLVSPFIAGLDLADGRVAPLVEAIAEATVADIPQVFAAWRGVQGSDAMADRVTRRDVSAAWRRAVDDWVRTTRREPPECGLSASPVETLAPWLAAMAAVPPPREVEWLINGGLSGVAGARALVLGHRGRSAADGTTICLGNPAVRRLASVAVVRADVAAEAACVAAAPVAAAPVTLACRREGGRVTWHRIAGGETLEIAPPRGTAIVDAA